MKIFKRLLCVFTLIIIGSILTSALSIFAIVKKPGIITTIFPFLTDERTKSQFDNSRSNEKFDFWILQNEEKKIPINGSIVLDTIPFSLVFKAQSPFRVYYSASFDENDFDKALNNKIDSLSQLTAFKYKGGQTGALPMDSDFNLSKELIILGKEGHMPIYYDHQYFMFNKVIVEKEINEYHFLIEKLFFKEEYVLSRCNGKGVYLVIGTDFNRPPNVVVRLAFKSS